MQFEWNEDKNQANRARHGLDFQTAALVFRDPHVLSGLDRHYDDIEERWYSIGRVETTVLYVAHTVWRTTMEKKLSASSRPAKQRRVKNEDITLNKQSSAQLLALESQIIDTTDPDTPEVTDWSTAERGKFYRPLKEQVTINLDTDVLAWFKQQHEPYQTLINAACRQYMEQPSKHS
jgi:uncharacterized DUF497 family protein